MTQTATAIELAILPDTRTPELTHENGAIDGNHSEAHIPQSSAEDAPSYSIFRTSIIIAAIAGVTTTNSMTTGLLTVGLPKLAEDLNLPNHLLLW